MNKCPICDYELQFIDWNQKIDGQYALFCPKCQFCFPFYLKEIKEIVFNILEVDT